MTQGKLGFGFMRLPVFDGNPENIDFEQLNQMVDEFIGNGFTSLSRDEEKLLEDLAAKQKESGPEHTGDFTPYEGISYHGVSVAAILDTYNSGDGAAESAVFRGDELSCQQDAVSRCV